ncbi:S41 family peptidase [Patescibacteria group bacterium]|nr:S41 family peptidase [Patescibacteria group bacterium]
MSLFKKIVLIVVVFAIFGVGFLVGRNTVVCKFCPPEDLDFSLFWEAWHKIQQEYVNPGDIDIQELIYGSISGMVESIGDPYTIFFNPRDTKKFLEDIGGEFEGIGAEIGIREGQLQIIAPLEGTPAQRAGLRPGDKIIKIDGVSTIDITIEEAVTLIRGAKGTEVILTIVRDEWDSSEDFIIKRAVIEVPSLKWELLEENIAYIKLYHFSEKIDQDFKEIATEILKTPAEKIILDLRNNPGGYLERSQDIAGWFLEKGQVVVIEDFGEKREQEIYKAKGNSKFSDYPLVILINQGSASASEILASALRDNRAIKMIGETSFGKGSVQKLESLRDGSSLKITIANWLTPNGDLITDKGLEPDIKVEMTEQDYEQERDPQLNKAIEIIKEIE